MAKLDDHRKPYARFKTTHFQIMREVMACWHRSTFPNIGGFLGMKKGPEGPFENGSEMFIPEAWS
jgi:hypothetical protein